MAKRLHKFLWLAKHRETRAESIKIKYDTKDILDIEDLHASVCVCVRLCRAIN